MITWTADEITRRIKTIAGRYGSLNPQQLRQLYFALNRANEREVYRGLMNVFHENDFNSQEIAGRLLLELKPECPDLRQSIQSVLGTWNVSVEELPFYLAEKFGKAELFRVLDAVEKESLAKDELRTIETFRFWLRGSM